MRELCAISYGSPRKPGVFIPCESLGYAVKLARRLRSKHYLVEIPKRFELIEKATVPNDAYYNPSIFADGWKKYVMLEPKITTTVFRDKLLKITRVHKRERSRINQSLPKGHYEVRYYG